MSLTITDVQRFCVHDGPGIRTTVFLKGCTLRCPWCANPETVNSKIEYAVVKDRCKKEHNHCAFNSDCKILDGNDPTEIDYKNCKRGAIVQIGKEINENELLNLIEKDKEYYEPEGGVTFSGGEPLIQLSRNIDFLRKVHEKYDVCIETALCVEIHNMNELQQNINLFFIDLKSLIDCDFKLLTGGELYKVIHNIELLNQYGRCNDIIFRIPFIRGYTNRRENVNRLNDLLKKYSPREVHILKLHNLAKNKYHLLNKTFNENENIDDKIINEFRLKIDYHDVKILKI